MKSDTKSLTESYGEVRELSKDKTGRFGSDTELRMAGYQIHARPAGGPTLWVKDGRVVEERVALLRLEKKILQEKGNA